MEQISKAQAYVLERLAVGLTMEGSGFKTRYRFPQRVVKEAITNAVVHRDYRLNRDIHIRIFDDRVEVESPGRLPGNLTPATIDKARSMPRNSMLARNLREFPNPPNVDAGEGVPMMFAQMAQASLYEPLYREQLEAAVPTLLVTLLNEERPPLWVQVAFTSTSSAGTAQPAGCFCCGPRSAPCGWRRAAFRAGTCCWFSRWARC